MSPPRGNSGPGRRAWPVMFRGARRSVRVHPGDGVAAGNGIKREIDPNNTNLFKEQGAGAFKPSIINMESVNIRLPVFTGEERMAVDDDRSSVSAPTSTRSTPRMKRKHPSSGTRPGPLSNKEGVKEGGSVLGEDIGEGEKVVDLDEMSEASGVSCRSFYKRKRGRPPTTGEFIGWKEAKEIMAENELEIDRLEIERELEREVTEARRTRSMGLEVIEAEVEESPFMPAQQRGGARGVNSETEKRKDYAEMTSSELRRVAAADAEVVVTMTAKSKNFKGTLVKALKEAAASMQTVVATLTPAFRRNRQDGSRKFLSQR